MKPFSEYSTSLKHPQKKDFFVEKTVYYKNKSQTVRFFEEDEYNEALKAYSDDKDRLAAEFKRDLFEELEIADNPKAEILYELVCERNCCGWYQDIFNEAEDLVRLIK
jgi:transketolase